MLRTALLVIVLAVFPIGIYHRLRSQATRESLDRWQEGLFILATLRPVGILLWRERCLVHVSHNHPNAN